MKDLNFVLGLKKQEDDRFKEFKQELRNYVCKKHGDVDAWFMQIPGMNREITICLECDKELRERNAEIEARKRAILEKELADKAQSGLEEAEVALVATGLPLKYRYLSRDSYKFRSQEEGDMKNTICDYIDKFEPIGSRWLFFKGAPGTGKSFAASIIACELFKQGYCVRYVRLTELGSEIKSRYKTGNSQEYINDLSNSDLLIIDEIGASNLSEDDYRNIFNILDSRYSNMKATILCSNSTNKSFFADPVRDRLSEICGSFKFNWTSWRSQNAKQRPLQ